MKPNVQISERVARRYAACSAVKHHRGNVQRAARATGLQPRYIKNQRKTQRKVKNLLDKARSGRPTILSRAEISAACTLVAEEQSVPVAVAMLKDRGLIPAEVSVRTVQRAVMKHMELVPVGTQPLLSQRTKECRLAFCQQQHDPDSLVAVDSTYLTLHAQWRRRKMWVMKGTRPVVNKPNKSQQLHVYAGRTHVEGSAAHMEQHAAGDVQKLNG